MADETIIPAVTAQETVVTPAQERITDLSDKVKTIAGERDTYKAQAEEATRKAAFAEGYADIVATYPNAREHKEDIAAKVAAGYSVEDAALAVLAKAGKLTAQPQAIQSPTGGSAANAITGSVEKPVGEMSLAEKRAQLEKEIVWQ